MEPIPFDYIDGPKLMSLLGFQCTVHPESWEDVGDAENGPRIIGGPAYDEWTRSEYLIKDGKVIRRDFSVYVQGGMVVGTEIFPPEQA
jgi:hypothetical protein